MMGFREFDHLTDNATVFDFGRGMRRSLADPRTQGFFNLAAEGKRTGTPRRLAVVRSAAERSRCEADARLASRQLRPSCAQHFVG